MYSGPLDGYQSEGSVRVAEGVWGCKPALLHSLEMSPSSTSKLENATGLSSGTARRPSSQPSRSLHAGSCSCYSLMCTAVMILMSSWSAASSSASWACSRGQAVSAGADPSAAGCESCVARSCWLVICPNFQTSTVNVQVKGSDSLHHSECFQVNNSVSGLGVLQGAGPVGDSVWHTCIILKKGPHLKPVC